MHIVVEGVGLLREGLGARDGGWAWAVLGKERRLCLLEGKGEEAEDGEGLL